MGEGSFCFRLFGADTDIVTLIRTCFKITPVQLQKEFRIFYFIHLQNEEAYERKESSSA